MFDLMMPEQNLTENLEWLKTSFFSDPQRQLRLEEGEHLLTPGAYNERLYLVLDGTLAGHIEDSNGNQYEIFRSGEGNLVGAYSFFSDHHVSYSTVTAVEPTTVAYLEHEDLREQPTTYARFTARILPIIVEEIYTRQLQAQRMSIETQETMRRLHQAEKLATLGQMAAGLAHELNNAMGVILKKAEWLSERLFEYIQEKDTRGLYPFFERALRVGQPLASVDVRQRRRELERTFKLSPHLAKEIAKIGLSDEEVRRYGNAVEQHADRVNYYYETGLALHDMLVAAKHASKVVQSVRELGAINRMQPVPIDLNKTLQEALALLEDVVKGIQVHLQLADGLPVIMANKSDWVQVWVNIIKNAAEALHSANLRRPEIWIRSLKADDVLQVAIADNGPGIPDELQEKIFQPNFTTKKEGLSFGLGLGLSIVQKIVETYRGSIQVDSRPGQTIFTIEIPLA